MASFCRASYPLSASVRRERILTASTVPSDWPRDLGHSRSERVHSELCRIHTIFPYSIYSVIHGILNRDSSYDIRTPHLAQEIRVSATMLDIVVLPQNWRSSVGLMYGTLTSSTSSPIIIIIIITRSQGANYTLTLMCRLTYVVSCSQFHRRSLVQSHGRNRHQRSLIPRVCCIGQFRRTR